MGQSKPNFMWSLHGSVEQKFVWGICVTWPRWPPRPYMVKTLQKSYSLEPKGQWPWALVCRALGPWAHQNLFKWWTLVDLDLFYGKVKFGPLCFYMEKTVRKSFNGRNSQQMTRVTWGICLHKNSDPRGLSSPAPGLYTCIKTGKSMYKIRLQIYFFETRNKWAKWQGLSVDIRILSTKGCLPLLCGYIHMEKH